MQRLLFAVFVTPGMLALACASAPENRNRQYNPDLITADEIIAANVATAFEVIERVRPQFLRTRGATSVLMETRVTVFQDNLNLGGVEMLRQIRAVDIMEIRYMSAGDATTRFGSGFPGGVIAVTSRRR